MPWKETTMSEQRHCFVLEVLNVGTSVAAACRKFGISRTTGYKWLKRHRQQPQQPLTNRSRRPQRCPNKTPDDIEQLILQVRDRYHWGAFKIWHYLDQQGQENLPSIKTIGNVLKRRGKIPTPATVQSPRECQRFERAVPNELWQCDFKGGWEIQGVKHYPLTVIDDHSRFLLALQLCDSVQMSAAWQVLWDVFGEYGLPQQLLCDNAFGSVHAVAGLSWLESRLIRLGIEPIHGRPYHPQTQGKVERLHGTLERELVASLDRCSVQRCQAGMDRWRREVYNSCRPHEGLAGKTPLSCWRPSPRIRPATLPELEYPPGSLTRVIAGGGDISWKGYRIRVGAGLVGERVAVEEEDHDVLIYYGPKQVRRIALVQLKKGTMA